MSGSRHHYIVTYDISDTTRLRRVHRTMRDFGDGIQLSVFWCQLSAKDKAELIARLGKIIKGREDQLLFVRLGPVSTGEEANLPDRCEALGRPLTPGFVRTVIV